MFLDMTTYKKLKQIEVPEVAEMKDTADKIFTRLAPKKLPIVPIDSQIDIAKANADSDNTNDIAQYVADHATPAYLREYYKEAIERLL